MDFIPLFGELFRADVRYLVVGDVAFSLLSEPRTTKDTGIIIEHGEENVRKLYLVFEKLGYKCRLPLEFEILIDRQALERLRDDRNLLALSYLRNADLPDVVDILLWYPFTFAEAYENRKIFRYNRGDYDFQINCISVEHLISMKRGTGRKQDEADIEKLDLMRPKLDLNEVNDQFLDVI